MSGTRIGEIKYYHEGSGKATIQLVGPVRLGDIIHVLGKFTDLRQKVTALQIDDRSVEEAVAGEEVVLRVNRRVHRRDKVFRLDEV